MVVSLLKGFERQRLTVNVATRIVSLAIGMLIAYYLVSNGGFIWRLSRK
jgi:hypothetical protein